MSVAPVSHGATFRAAPYMTSRSRGRIRTCFVSPFPERSAAQSSCSHWAPGCLAGPGMARCRFRRPSATRSAPSMEASACPAAPPPCQGLPWRRVAACVRPPVRLRLRHPILQQRSSFLRTPVHKSWQAQARSFPRRTLPTWPRAPLLHTPDSHGRAGGNAMPPVLRASRSATCPIRSASCRHCVCAQSLRPIS